METQAEERVRIYYTRGEAFRNYMSTDMMEALNKEDLDREYRMPTTLDLINDYVCVADFPFNRGEIPYHIHQQFEDRDADWDKQKCEALFYFFNHVDYEGVSGELCSQEVIKELELHTSMSIGDVIRIEDRFYYCDGMGFKEFDPARMLDSKDS